MMHVLILLSFTYSFIPLCVCRHVSNNLSSSSYTSHYIKRGEVYCKITSCTETDTFVKSCEKNGTSDSCIPCPPGTEMKNLATSRVINFKCVRKKQCPPDTRPVNYTTTCPSIQGYRISCECDRTRGYCGVDPCDCRGKTCPVGLYVEQNCGCSFIKEFKSVRLTTPLRRPTSTESINITRSTTVFQELPRSSNNSIDSSIDRFTTTHPYLGEVEQYTNDYTITITAVIAAVVIVVITVGIIYCICTKCISKGSREAPHYYVTYKAENMLIGNNSTMHNVN